MPATAKTDNGRAAFELKGSALTLMVLRLLEADADALGQQLHRTFGAAGGFFRSAPLVVDLGALPAGADLDLPALVQRLRGFGLVPVALRGGSEAQALGANLGLLPAGRGEAEAAPALPEPAPEPPAQVAAPAAARVVTSPVRSGQRVVAPEGDLVVLASVNPGAELLAAGNIHVYGALRGRALAGIRGDAAARIVCLQFYPELVAVAGEYRLHDELEPAHLGRSVVVSLLGETLNIEPLGTFAPLAPALSAGRPGALQSDTAAISDRGGSELG